MKKKNALINAVQSHDTTTANGAVSHSTTGTSVLDFFSRGGAMRQNPEAEIIKLFSAAYSEDKNLAVKALYYLGDVRSGQGERRLFRTCLKWLAQNHAKTATKLLKYVPEFTRWDNILESTENTPVEDAAFELLAKQLQNDVDAETPSLCAKWLPSESASSETTRRLAAKMRKFLNVTPKQYRKTLSALRAKLNVVERDMCNGNWKKISFSNVPSRAAYIYKNAFNKHAPVQYSSFLKKVEKGEAKINASVLYPYDLVRGIESKTGNDLRTVEAQWKALPDYLADNKYNALPVLDLSGSMTSSYGGNVRPIDVAVSIGVYFSERNKGQFANVVVPFSAKARFVELTGDSLKSKVNQIMANHEVANTNLQSVFDLILNKAVQYKVPQKEMPDVLFLISDCQFDSIVDNASKTNHEVIKEKYKKAGYKLPSIVFWNVNASSDSPVKFDEKGTALVSGCSPVIFKNALALKNTTPYDGMLEVLNSDRYKSIKA